MNECAFYNFHVGRNGRGIGKCKILTCKCDLDTCNFKKSPYQLWESERNAEKLLKSKGLEKTLITNEEGVQCVSVKRIK